MYVHVSTCEYMYNATCAYEFVGKTFFFSLHLQDEILNVINSLILMDPSPTFIGLSVEVLFDIVSSDNHVELVCVSPVATPPACDMPLPHCRKKQVLWLWT